METLINFLKFSSVLDWLVIFLTLVLILVAGVLLFVLRRPKPFYFVIASAVFPLLGGLLSTFIKHQQMQRALQEMGNVSNDVLAQANAEAWVITYIAAAGALMIALIGIVGVMMKKSAARD